MDESFEAIPLTYFFLYNSIFLPHKQESTPPLAAAGWRKLWERDVVRYPLHGGNRTFSGFDHSLGRPIAMPPLIPERISRVEALQVVLVMHLAVGEMRVAFDIHQLVAGFFERTFARDIAVNDCRHYPVQPHVIKRVVCPRHMNARGNAPSPVFLAENQRAAGRLVDVAARNAFEARGADHYALIALYGPDPPH